MSNFYPELKGTLGENLYKKQDKEPDMKGRCMINGVNYNISGWIKEGNNGPFYSLSFSVKEKKEAAQPGSKIIKPQARPADLQDDEVPF